MNTMKKKDLRR